MGGVPSKPRFMTRLSAARIACFSSILTAFLLVCTGTHAQFDNEFWMPPIWTKVGANYDDPSSLLISTSVTIPVDVHIETPDGTTFVWDGVVSSTNPVELPLTTTLGQTTLSNTVITDNGFIITSSHPVQVVHKVSAFNNQTLVTLKGDNALGQDFWAGSQTQNGTANGSNEYHWISVMASENNTTITFETPNDMVGYEGLTSFDVVLSQHESYLVRTANAQDHVAGAHITSDKDIVVISGSTHTQFEGQGERDGGADQLVPVPLLGTNYVVVKGLNADPGDYAIVVATEDNTNIYLDGALVPADNIDAGETFEYTLTGSFGDPHLIQTTEKTAVYHVTGASSNQEVGMSAIPRLICTGTRYVEFPRFTVNSSAQVFTLVAQNDALGTLTFNGTPYASVPGVVISAVPGIDYTAVSIPDSQVQTNNIVESDESFFHVGYLTGNGTATGTYGYLSGFDEAFDFIDPATGFPADIIALDTICPGEIIDYCFEIISCSFDHNITGVSGNVGNVVVTPSTTPFDSCFAYTAPFNFSGPDTIHFEVSNFLGFEGEVDVVFTIADPDTPIDAGPSQTLCTGTSTTISAIDPDPLATGTWSVFSGSATIVDPGNPTTDITDLVPGTHTFLWSQTYPCGETNFDFMQVIVYDGSPPVAVAGDDGELCSGTTFTMGANDPGTSATGTWEVLQGQAFIPNINDPNVTISNLAVGENVLLWTINNGDCPGGETSDQITIWVFDVGQSPADAGDDQTYCSLDFTTGTLAGNTPTFPATGEWQAVSGDGTIDAPADPGTTVSGLPPGVHTFAWVIDNGPCGILTDEVVITVYNDALDAANAGPNAEYCLPTNFHTVTATPPASPATGTWALVSGSGSIDDPSSPTTNITNLGVGQNVFSWSLDNGGCTNDGSFSQVSITIFDNTLPPADAGPDQEFCDATFVSATLDAVAAPVPAVGLWTVQSGNATFADATDPGTTVTDLAPGLNVLAWTVTNGPCGHTSDTVEILLFEDNPAAMQAGDDASYCTPTSSHSMNATAPALPATGFWTLESGTGTISNTADPLATISGLGVGENVFRWTLVNGPCGPGGNFDEVSIFIFDENQPAAAAGDDQDLCLNPALPLTTDLAANAAIFPGSGAWTIVSGTATLSSMVDPLASVTDLVVGELVLEWTISNGACDPASTTDQVVITVFDAFEPAAEAGADQNLCFDDPTTTLTATAPTFPATGSWSVQSGPGMVADASDPLSSVSGLGVGVNVLVWTVDNGPCGAATSDSVTLTVFDDTVPPVAAGDDIETCSTEPSITLSGSAVTPPATGIWTVVSGSATFADDSDPGTEVSALSLGEVVLEWTVDNGPCGVTNSDQVSVFVSNSDAPLAFAGPDQNICNLSPSTTLGANVPEFPATGVWVLASGVGTVTNPNDPNSTVTGLAVGENIFQWTIDNAPCTPSISGDFVSIFVYDGLALDADAGSDQEHCSQVTTFTVSGNVPVFPSTGVWSLVSGTGTITSPTSATTTLTGLSLGDNVFQWLIDSGPCPDAISTDTVTITLFDENQPAATAGDDQSFCSTTTATTLNGNDAPYPASGLWTLVSGTGVFDDATDRLSGVSSLTVGENIFQWTIDNGPCGLPTSDQVSVFIYDDTATDAAAGPDQSICNTTTFVTMAANSPVFPASGSWTLVSGAGSIDNAASPVSTITGLAVGENVFEWSIDNNGCAGGTTTDQVSVFVYFEDAAPASAGPDQDLCTPNVDTFMAGNLPVFPATGAWVLVSGGGSLTDASDPNTEVTGLSVGENIFEWSINNGPCTSGITTDQVSLFVFDSGADAPDAGPDQELCSPTFTTNMAAVPAVDPGIGTWSLFSGSGSITSVNDPLSEITGLAIGVNTFVWTVDYATCGTPADTVQVIVYDSSQSGADAGLDQSWCAPVSSTNLDATPINGPASGAWTLFSGNGSIVDPSDPSTEVQNLTVGENVFVWTMYNGGCTALPMLSDTVSVFIFDDAQDPADAGPDQFLCTPQTSSIMQGGAITFPATGNWTLVSGAGTVTDPSDPMSDVTGLAVGENVFEWSLNNGACPGAATTDQVSLFVYDNNQLDANAGADQLFCTPVANTNLEGNAVTFPASGAWTLISGGGTILDPANPTATVSDLIVGENIFQWTVNNGPCGTPTSDVVSVFIYDQFNPVADAGEDQEFCTPVSSTTLAGNNPTFPAFGTWTLFSGTGSITSPNDPNTEVTGLTVGENIFVWTVDNGPCPDALSQDTMSVFLFADAAPLANAGDDQQFCTPTSTTTMFAQPAADPGYGTWTLVSGSGVITDPNDPLTEITGLAIGDNVFEWELYNGPCALSGSTDQVTITLFDESQADANAGPDEELCTPITATILTGNAALYPATGMWTLVNGTGVFVDDTDEITAVSGLSIGVNTFVWSISNGPCLNALTQDTVVVFVFDNVLEQPDAGPDQELCLPDQVAVLTATPLTSPTTGIWTQTAGGGAILDPTSNVTSVTGLTVGTNTFVWTVDNGTCGTLSDTLNVLVFDPDAALADAGPDQDLCTPQTTTSLQGNTPAIPGGGTWDLVGGTATIGDPTDPGTVISGLTIGENILTWTIYNGPCADATVDTVSVFIFDENAPAANAGDDQELCLPTNATALNGNAPIFPATGSWTVTAGSGVLDDDSDPTTGVTGLSLGTNTFVWSLNNSPCLQGVTTDTVNVLVFAEEIAPVNAGPDQSWCTPASTSLMNATPLADPNTGTWTLSSGSGVFGDATDPNTIVSGLTVGSNVFVWTVYNGPCAAAAFSDTVQVDIYDEFQLPANAGTDQELCLPATTTVLDGNLVIAPAIGTWELIGGSGVFSDANDPNALVSGLSLGVNSFTWTINNGPCDNAITTDTLLVTVYESLIPEANAGADIEICTPESSVTLDATPPTVPTQGTWSWVIGSAGISDIHDPNAVITGLAVGEYVLQWDVYNGPCTEGASFDFVTISVFDLSSPAADAGPDQDFCAPVDETTLDAEDPIFPSVGTWTLVSGLGGLADVNDPNTTFSGLEIGEHMLTWSVYNGPCFELTVDTLLVTVYDPDSPDADAGEDQYFCTPFGGATLDGNAPLNPAPGWWSLISGAGNFTDETIPNTTIFDLSLGENILVWHIDNGPCANGLTTDTVSLFVNDISVAEANAGLDQFYCGGLDSLQMAGSVTIGNTATGVWNLIAGGGTFGQDDNEATFVYDIPVGVNTYTWTVDNFECGITSDTVSVVIYDPTMEQAYAGEDAFWCEDEFEPFELEATQVLFPGTGYWEIAEGPIEISDENDPNAIVEYLGFIFEPLTVEQSVLIWNVDNGVCGSSSDSLVFVLQDCLTIDIPDAFSPNDDGYGDEFFIPNLYKYPNNTIKIFNRWGQEVFQASPYNGDWNGMAQSGLGSGPLPVSTYYYVLDLGDGSEPRVGFIYLRR